MILAIGTYINGKKKNRTAVITGLGYAFVYNTSKYKFMKFVISFFYRIAEKRIKIIAQNPDDLIDLGLSKSKVIFIYGTDVISPSKTSVKPSLDFAAVRSNAEIYWLLTLAFKDTLEFDHTLPLIFNGGNPTFSW